MKRIMLTFVATVLTAMGFASHKVHAYREKGACDTQVVQTTIGPV
jgi:hypothetical protein